jgi:hypothetical protein
MVHTPFFKAGIAGDGSYNRTLTPLGFQSERRDLWEAPNVYLGMSPFLYANNLSGALLMYHGLHDQNVGTDPDNSVRLSRRERAWQTTLCLYPLEDLARRRGELLDLGLLVAGSTFIKTTEAQAKDDDEPGGGEDRNPLASQAPATRSSAPAPAC